MSFEVCWHFSFLVCIQVGSWLPGWNSVLVVYIINVIYFNRIKSSVFVIQKPKSFGLIFRTILRFVVTNERCDCSGSWTYDQNCGIVEVQYVGGVYVVVFKFVIHLRNRYRCFAEFLLSQRVVRWSLSIFYINAVCGVLEIMFGYVRCVRFVGRLRGKFKGHRGNESDISYVASLDSRFSGVTAQLWLQAVLLVLLPARPKNVFAGFVVVIP